MSLRPILTALLFSTLPAVAASADTATPTAIPTAVPATRSGQAGLRQVVPLETAWSFHRADVPGAETLSPVIVDLPHDWSIAGDFSVDSPAKRGGAYLPTGTAQYRKLFTLPLADKGKHVEIQFDGITANGEVFINGHALGLRPYPYVSVHYDLTPYLKYGDGAEGLNVIDVNVNNSLQPVSRYYTGSGIERHVRLVIANPVHLETWGVYITTPEVTQDKATVHLEATVANTADKPRSVFINTFILTAESTAIGPRTTSEPATIPAGQSYTFKQDIAVEKPRLWDVDVPNLYRALVAVVDNELPKPANDNSAASDSRNIDREFVPFGIRKIEFKPETGFWLNDRNVKILGVCIHEDGGAAGEAVPRSVYEARFAAMKALGANAIRLAHNPPNPVELDVCDKMGILVMDEMYDCWMTAKPNAEKGYNLFFKEWSLRDLKDIVLRDRNHPSIIMWSAGNEIHDSSNSEATRTILRGLVDAFHQYDPSRPVTQALLQPDSKSDYTNGYADMQDVIGTNYRDSYMVTQQQAVPTRKLINTEEHQDPRTWAFLRDHPQLAGCFLWAGIDYLGEGFAMRQPGVDDPSGAWPRTVSGSGLVDTTLTVKPNGFEREAWWSTKPVVHIARSSDRPVEIGAGGSTPPASARLVDDWSPQNNYPQATVQVFSNCEEVELFLNGQTLGKKTLPKDASPRVWQVAYAPGELKAVGRNGGKEAATDILQTAGKPAKIMLVADRDKATPTFDDVVFVRAVVTDDKGVRVPVQDAAVKFTVDGPGKVVATDNGKLDNHVPYPNPERTTKDGRVLALVRATDASGKITVTASANGLQAGTVTLTAAPAAPAPTP